jgi:hypothetical protein
MRRDMPASRAKKSNSLGKLLLSIVLACTASSALAVDPGKKISQYGHTAWRLQDGYFTGSIAAITQTTDGYLWIGTERSLAFRRNSLCPVGFSGGHLRHFVAVAEEQNVGR